MSAHEHDMAWYGIVLPDMYKTTSGCLKWLATRQGCMEADTWRLIQGHVNNSRNTQTFHFNWNLRPHCYSDVVCLLVNLKVETTIQLENCSINIEWRSFVCCVFAVLLYPIFNAKPFSLSWKCEWWYYHQMLRFWFFKREIRTNLTWKLLQTTMHTKTTQITRKSP